MKKLEKLTVVFTFIGIAMKILKLPGSGLLIVFTLSLLSTLYYPLGTFLFNEIKAKTILKKASYSGISLRRIIGSFLFGMILSIATMSILFSFMSWPGAVAMRIIGLVLAIPAFIVCIIKFNKTRNIFYKNLLIRITIIVIAVVICFFLPKNLVLNKPSGKIKKAGRTDFSKHDGNFTDNSIHYYSLFTF